MLTNMSVYLSYIDSIEFAAPHNVLYSSVHAHAPNLYVCIYLLVYLY